MFWSKKFLFSDLISLYSSRLDTSQSKGYPSEGGYFHEEAILLLRKFYIRENKHGKWQVIMMRGFKLIISILAPVPRKKSNRVLKTEIIPMNK
jgi:tRNA-specific adenosine deaminase 2